MTRQPSRASSSFSKSEITTLEDLLCKLVSGTHELADMRNNPVGTPWVSYRNNADIMAIHRKMVSMKEKVSGSV